ncbi:peroxidase family protein [Rhizobium sp. EC-SD404]|uniref:peroxidase family protein n=1 Tax=Rhizobium sp. EC-SD404 TaxID=2038389 RepID=UPI001259C883|nr:peroxidase family protein [Rhizobium sp. EC-SD404]VVT08480.1 Animal hem peroxidase [Rhizobium sp. EC-SD404]
MTVKLNLADMQFILKQIKIAEGNSTAHSGSNALELTDIYVDALGNVVPQGTPGAVLAIPDPHTPFGLRTVDGSYNNILPGREFWGASNQPMPRLFEPNYINDSDLDSIDLNGPAPGGNLVQGNYAPGQSVVDADPRTISNLIVDMSINNPAAIYAALVFAGSEDPQADLEEILARNISVADAAENVTEAQAAVDDATAALTAAVGAYSAAVPATIDAIQAAAVDLAEAEATLATAQTVAANPQASMKALAEEKGITFNGNTIDIPNVAPDEGLSAPFNAWMTFFGQFFDHGLDLITKGGAGTVYVPLAADDPLVTHGPDGILGNGDEVPESSQFMVLTRATTVPGAGGVPTQVNVTTPFVDQNQTYTSNASHQVFLREYTMVEGEPMATGRLLTGTSGGLATWADVKEQALEMLGIQLSDMDVFAVPLLRTDAYGEFIRGDDGFPQVILSLGADGIPNTADDGVASGTPDNPVVLHFPVTGVPVPPGAVVPIRTANAFLDDIAHNAVPKLLVDHDRNPGTPPLAVTPDEDDVPGNVIEPNEFGVNLTYDDELLDHHFITGDGRGNENIGLTAVHHIFHSEHNRQIDAQKLTILQSGDLSFINEWLNDDLPAGTVLPTNLAEAQTLATQLNTAAAWDGERLFQAGRFATEMQYQHLVFEEFGRKIQPMIDVFVFNSITDVDPSIFAEFANVVYRFGHSMLTENMPRIDAAGNVLEDVGLVEAFLDPILFDEGMSSHDEAAASIIRGMTTERGNEIDEFVVNALRNNLLGLPLDLAAINIARGRDTGMPTLNEAREQLYAASGSSFLTPYTSWSEFAANLKNPISVVNFIAAYGKHPAIAGTLEQKRAAALELVLGVDAAGNPTALAGRSDFLNSTGAWNAELSGLNDIDLWIGGLAEKKMPFGGMLGSTFNAVFELQMENLQDGDRFYYLTRTQGQNFLNELEQNSFSKMMLANTALAQAGPDGIRGTSDDIVNRHIGVDSFARYDYVLEVNEANQADQNGDLAGKDPVGTDPFLEAMGLGKVVRDDPGTIEVDENYLRFFGGEHVVFGGTNGNDTIIADFGDDGIWGDAGDDRIEAGAGVDLVNGGAGNDIITDSGDTGDFLKGEEGDDVIANSNGLDIIMGGSGKDAVFVGVDATEVFGGEGDDFILGGDDMDFLMGNEGNDWMEAGAGFDTTAGDNSELFFNSAIKGHDVMFAGSDEHDFDAESGDDIMVQGESVMRNEGMFGFDWAIFKGMQFDGYADMRIPIFTTEAEDILRNRFDKTEALSGWNNNDTLIGDDRVFGELAPGDTVATTENIFFNDGLDAEGLARIEGLSEIVSLGASGLFESGNVLLGGAGNDRLQGNGGDDIIDGDRWLNVQIAITSSSGNAEVAVDTMKHVFTASEVATLGLQSEWANKSLFELMVARQIEPAQMRIVRSVVDSNDAASTDVAVFNDVITNYTITHNANGSLTVTQNAVTNVVDPQTERNLVSDGTDTVWNVEELHFANGVVYTVDQPAQGNLVLSTTTPTQGQALTVAIDGITDANGTTGATFAISWQRLVDGTWVNLPGATTATFTPGLGDVNSSIRAVVSFIDDAGNAEQIFSEQTEVVGMLYNGNGQANNELGTAGADFMNGAGGNDILNGLGSGDTLLGGGGSDTLVGGDGDDTLNGEGGADTLSGDAGNDILLGGAANDVLTGGIGDDTLNGEAGADTLNGDDGDDLLDGGAGNDTLNGGAGNDALSGGLGRNTINGGDGDDTITWNVGDGRDIIDGGVGGTDTVIINGDASEEIYRVWTRQTWDEFPGNNIVALHADTEIVITRNGVNNASVIAELRNVEEIVINTGDGADTILTNGDFEPTQLSQNTIRVNSGVGDKTIDISGLLSSHRLHFTSLGGNVTLIGTLRPQDVVVLAPGDDLSTYTLATNTDGSKTFGNGTNSITFTGDVPPQFQQALPPEDNDDEHEDDETENEDGDDNGVGDGDEEHEDGEGDDDDSDDDGDDEAEDEDEDEDEDEESESEDDEDNSENDDDDDDDGDADQGTVTIGGTNPGEIIGGHGADVLIGRAVADTIIGLGGNDKISAGDGEDAIFGGDGDDTIHAHGNQDEVFGGAGNDQIDAGWGHDTVYGEDGDDILTGAEGNDKLFGGDGDDLFIASVSDEADTYWGGEGIDTIDYAALTEDLTINLGNGLNERGSVTTAAGVRDVIYSIENAIGGGGNDTITASDAINVLDGGEGSDVYRFLSTLAADGDTIMNFEPGDRIDVSAIDANVGVGGNQQFQLVSGGSFTSAGQIRQSHITTADGEFTILSGNVDGNTDADFEIAIKGRHHLTDTDILS